MEVITGTKNRNVKRSSHGNKTREEGVGLDSLTSHFTISYPEEGNKDINDSHISLAYKNISLNVSQSLLKSILMEKVQLFG